MAQQADGRRTLRFDVVVVGAGVAGLVAALDLIDAEPGIAVAVLDKGTMGSTGSTPLAQGGMAVAVGPDDTPHLHALDTIAAGDGLCDPEAVRVVTREAPARLADLVRRGAVFDRGHDGGFSLAREGGQRVARSVRAADASGAEIFRALRAAATGHITRIQGIACEIVLDDGRAVGVWALLDDLEASVTGPAQAAGLALLLAGDVVLATGGCGGLYAATTNRDGATADGVALAHRAGAALLDMEFVQFHPTGLKIEAGTSGGFWRFLLTEALRGAGATLVDRDGNRFMPDRHPDAELGPRHVVAKGILDQAGGAWLDATNLPQTRLAEEFPTVLAGARHHGYDLATEPVPVEPAEHYMVGGIATDLHGATSVPGLWAAGEVASTGVHGANRMAGNSLAQACVFGHRIARALAAGRRSAAPARASGTPAPQLSATGPSPADLADLRVTLRHTMSAGAGAIRSAGALDEAEAVIAKVAGRLGPAPQASRDAIEVAHMALVAELIVRSARLRTESRGVHWRSDHPRHSADWSGRRVRIAHEAASRG